MRIRDPIKGRQIEKINEKWLVMDKFIKVKSSTVSKYLFQLEFDVFIYPT